MIPRSLATIVVQWCSPWVGMFIFCIYFLEIAPSQIDYVYIIAP